MWVLGSKYLSVSLGTRCWLWVRRCEALAAVGKTWENSEAQRRACGFVVKHQHEDGGWGESYLSSQDKVGNLVAWHCCFASRQSCVCLVTGEQSAALHLKD